jgi:hypothetical protein
MEEVGCVLQSWLGNSSSVIFTCRNRSMCWNTTFGDCTHHPAGIFILAQLAQLCVVIVIISPLAPSPELSTSL